MYEHHCIGQLPGPTRALRDGALYMVNNIEAVQWALELYGFKNVVIKVCTSKLQAYTASARPSALLLLYCAAHAMHETPFVCEESSPHKVHLPWAP